MQEELLNNPINKETSDKMEQRWIIPIHFGQWIINNYLFLNTYVCMYVCLHACINILIIYI